MAGNKFNKTVSIDYKHKEKVEQIEKLEGGFSGFVNKEIQKYKEAKFKN